MSKRLNQFGLLVFALVLMAGPVLALPAVSSAGLRLSPVSTPAPHPSRDPGTVLGPVALGMGIRIRDTASIAKKFVTNAQRAGGDYTDGVAASGQDWEANTKAAEPNWKAGVNQAAADGRFGKGVSAAGSAKYLKRATTLGAQRYPTGVGASQDDYARGVAPHLEAMKGLELPPRGPKGDPGNMRRAQVVADRNRAIRLGK